MYVLHYTIDSAALVIRLALEELAQPYRAVLLDRDKGQQDSPAFRRLQPLGLVPAFETPDGPMFETAAILLWLADRHAALAPSPASPERAAFLKWFFFTVSHLHPVLLQIFYPERYAGSPEAEAAFTQGAVTRAKTALHLLDRRATEDNPQWFSPAQPSILGYYVSTLARWLKMFKPGEARHIDFSAYPGLAAIAAALEARPAALAAARAEGLGATIFTAPVYD